MTNIDHEHMESYGSFADLQQAFARLREQGAVLRRRGGVRRRRRTWRPILPRITRQVVTYGLDDPRAHDRRHRRRARRVRRTLPGAPAQRARPWSRSAASSWRCPAVTTCRTRWPRWRSVSASASTSTRVADALAGFHGAERRFERHGEAGGVLVVDDYGHHPTEIAAVLAAARATLDRRLIVGVSAAPLLADRAAARRVRAGAGRTPTRSCSPTSMRPARIRSRASPSSAGRIDPRRIAAVRCTWSRRSNDVVPELLTIVRPGDAVITLGAGSIGTVPKRARCRRSHRKGGALMPVAAPADKRFRRAHVSPKRRRSWRPSWWTLGAPGRRVRAGRRLRHVSRAWTSRCRRRR